MVGSKVEVDAITSVLNSQKNSGAAELQNGRMLKLSQEICTSNVNSFHCKVLYIFIQFLISF